MSPLLLLFSQSEMLFLDLMCEWCADVAIKVPQIDAVLLTAADYSGIIGGAEHHPLDRVGVTDKRLKEVWHGLVGLIVPDLQHGVLAAGQEVPGVL